MFPGRRQAASSVRFPSARKWAEGEQVYTCDFVPVPAAEMEGLANFGVLTVLHRDGPRTVIYCHADHISVELAARLTETATLYTRATVRYNEPVSPRQYIDWIRVPRAELPPNVLSVACLRGRTGIAAYVAAEHITDELALQLAEITAEETRYLAALPVIAPVAYPATG
jgi:hypothetical protein